MIDKPTMEASTALSASASVSGATAPAAGPHQLKGCPIVALMFGLCDTGSMKAGWASLSHVLCQATVSRAGRSV